MRVSLLAISIPMLRPASGTPVKCRDECPTDGGLVDLQNFNVEDTPTSVADFVLYKSNEGPFHSCTVQIQKVGGPAEFTVLWDFLYAKTSGAALDQSHHALSGLMSAPSSPGRCTAKCYDAISQSEPIYGAKIHLTAFKSIIRYNVVCTTRGPLLMPEPTPIGSSRGGQEDFFGSIEVETAIWIGVAILLAGLICCLLIGLLAMRAGRKAGFAAGDIRNDDGDQSLDEFIGDASMPYDLVSNPSASSTVMNTPTTAYNTQVNSMVGGPLPRQVSGGQRYVQRVSRSPQRVVSRSPSPQRGPSRSPQRALMRVPSVPRIQQSPSPQAKVVKAMGGERVVVTPTQAQAQAPATMVTGQRRKPPAAEAADFWEEHTTQYTPGEDQDGAETLDTWM